jgi:hypothetical protein
MSRRRDTTYTPAPYAGDGLEVVANLSADVPPHIAENVAKWHDRKNSGRSRTIATALRALVPANDNGGRR